MAEENKFSQSRLDQIKTIKKYALKIIAFISQFENELVTIWNKPKFVLNSNYVITVDKMNFSLLEKIISHENFSKQIEEWQNLEMVEKNFSKEKFLENLKSFKNSKEISQKDLKENKNFLFPIDTKFFKNLENDILLQFDHLDDSLDGRLIHSENYQALNTLKEKYKNKVQCIYIDPPYNTGNDEFVYKDKFKHSSWLTFMANRLQQAKQFLKEDGVIFVQCDDNEQAHLKLLMDDVFGRENFVGQFIWKNKLGGGNDASIIVTEHEYSIVFSKKINKLEEFTEENEDNGKYINEDEFVKIRGK